MTTFWRTFSHDGIFGPACWGWRCTFTLFTLSTRVTPSPFSPSQAKLARKSYLTAYEGPVRIQYKCVVPISVFPERTLLYQEQNYNVLSLILHSCICERFIYFHQSANSAAGKYVDQSWKKHKSLTGTWMWKLRRGGAIPRKGIHKWDFPCSAVLAHVAPSPLLSGDSIQCTYCTLLFEDSVGRTALMVYQSSHPPPPHKKGGKNKKSVRKNTRDSPR